jgi:two-component system, cell cycle sensor histidine kinase and response regulator CckA
MPLSLPTRLSSHSLTAVPQLILVADDDPATRTVITSMLEPEGYRFLEACDGLEALRLAEQHDGPIDLLITDVNMPRMTGHELARLIKAVSPCIRVLIVSSISECQFPADAVHHTHALLKPVKLEDLVSTVKALLAA